MQEERNTSKLSGKGAVYPDSGKEVDLNHLTTGEDKMAHRHEKKLNRLSATGQDHGGPNESS